ncbi:MAG: hypothetical protein JRD68_08910 [Deltaproteobacteria bacterium]|nr:hypothetical protein [Deltaproteobacteria bacterium]
MTKNSFYLKIYLTLDVSPGNNPDESISGLEIYAWRVKNVTGKAIHAYNDMDDVYTLNQEDNGIDSEGNLLGPMKLKTFPDIWSVNNEKYTGDYAAGLYDLSGLIDEDAVLKTVIADIKSLAEKWSS